MKILILALMLFIPTAAFPEYYPMPEHKIFGEPYTLADKVAIDDLIEAFKRAWAEEDAAGVAAVSSRFRDD